MHAVPAARPVFVPEDRAEIGLLVDEALRTGSLTLGPLTKRFEAAFAAHHGTKHAVAVSSGTAALEIIFRALDIAGREVIVPTNTFFATAAAVLHAGGLVRFADVDRTTFSLSPTTVEPLLTERTAAVVLVHIGGSVSPHTAALREMCERRGIALVEDAAHAHGASINGRYAGSFGIAGAFSFYPTKVITAGEGGMIVTDDDHVYEEATIYRDQGKGSFLGGGHIRLGAAWRMSELHAAVGLVQFGRLNEFLAVRNRVAARYREGLEGISGIEPLPVPAGGAPNYYKYVVMLESVDRATLKNNMREKHAVSLSGEVYATPLHKEPVFAEHEHESLPTAEDVCARHVCLPVHSDMTDAEVDQVIAGLAQEVDELAGSVTR